MKIYLVPVLNYDEDYNEWEIVSYYAFTTRELAEKFDETQPGKNFYRITEVDLLSELPQ
jgi:hypothetical protein